MHQMQVPRLEHLGHLGCKCHNTSATLMTADVGRSDLTFMIRSILAYFRETVLAS